MRRENQRETVKVRERGGAAARRRALCVRRRAMVVRETRARFLAWNEGNKKAHSVERAVEIN